jgi:hypothetical protein
VVHIRVPEFEEHWRVFDDVAEYTRKLVGSNGVMELGYLEGGQIGVFEVVPANPRSCGINVIAEQFFTVTVGAIGGRWELDYEPENVELVKQIIAAAVDGRLEERSALGRSRVAVILENGTTIHETGYDGCASLFVPQFGWTRWGRLTSYEPYEGIHA